MIRSESRTEETSGLVTTTATSAKRIARVAPFSIPAGLSQMIQSNCARSSSMTFSTPASVSASLSRVWGGRQQMQLVDPPVADQRLSELGVALHDIDQVEHDAALSPHHQVEISQADVEIDHHHVLARLRQRRTQGRRRRGLSHAALAGRNHHYLGHAINNSLPAR